MWEVIGAIGVFILQYLVGKKKLSKELAARFKKQIEYHEKFSGNPADVSIGVEEAIEELDNRP